MDKVLVIRRNTDMTEGRGMMIVDTIWALDARVDAEAYLLEQRGVMGRKEDWRISKFLEWRIDEEFVLGKGADPKNTKAKRAALNKLTEEEKILLGLDKFQP